MSDLFDKHAPGLESPATKAFAITGADSVILDPIPRGLHCNAAGDLVAVFAGDDTTAVTLSLVAGTFYPYRVKIVKAATDAEIVGLT